MTGPQARSTAEGHDAALARSAAAFTTRAALIHQHTAMERDRVVADALGKLAEEALSKQDPDRSGT